MQGVQFTLSPIVARLLLPADYGLIAMLSIFMSITQTFIDSSLANALIWKEDRTDTDYSTVFYFNIVIPVLIYLLLYMFSPWIVKFYEEDQSVPIIWDIGLTLITSSFGTVQQAKITVSLNFRRQIQASLSAVVLSGGAGVWLTYSGYGTWTLACQSLLDNFFRVILAWFFFGWVPGRGLSLESFRTLFSFDSRLLLSSLLHILYKSPYTLIIGKKFSAARLGYYNRAFTLAQFPSTNLTDVIVRAVYPIQCELQDDEEALSRMLLRHMRMARFLVFPVMLILCVLADSLVCLLLTDKWIETVPLLQIFCIVYMWDPVMKINNSLLNIRGRSDYFLYTEILKRAMAFLTLFATIPLGVKRICASLILYSFVDMVIITYYTRKLARPSMFVQIYELSPILSLTFTMGGIVYIITLLNIPPFAQLVIGRNVGIAYYLYLSYSFDFQEFDLIKHLVKEKISP